MQAQTSTQDTLLPFTKFVLGVSAVVQLTFAVIGLFLTDLWNSLIWSAPLTPWPEEVATMAFLSYVATAAAAAYALYQGKWSGARVFLVFGFVYNLLSVIVVFIIAASPGVPPIMWVLVALGIIYLPVVAYIWQHQSRGA